METPAELECGTTTIPLLIKPLLDKAKNVNYTEKIFAVKKVRMRIISKVRGTKHERVEFLKLFKSEKPFYGAESPTFEGWGKFLKSIYKSENGLLLSYHTSSIDYGLCLLFPYTLKLAVIVKSPAMTKELSNLPRRFSDNWYALLGAEKKIECLVDRFLKVLRELKYPSNGLTQIDHIYEIIDTLQLFISILGTDLGQVILELEKKFGNDHQSDFHSLIGYMIVVLETADEKYLLKIDGLARKMCMAKPAGLNLNRFLDDEFHTRYSFKSEKLLRAIYDSSVTLVHPDDSTSESESCKFYKPSLKIRKLNPFFS